MTLTIPVAALECLNMMINLYNFSVINNILLINYKQCQIPSIAKIKMHFAACDNDKSEYRQLITGKNKSKVKYNNIAGVRHA